MGARWLRNTKILRERFRFQKSKFKGHKTSKIQEKGLSSSDKDNEDLVSMVTVLRKIYKEVQLPSIIDLIRCWLALVDDNDVCVLTRGDSKGRMRRIDGGKGPDKVWRLDTLVSMLYHGLPLTSADSSLVYHSCKHDLCVRPQHLRVRLSSLAVVLVLKALAQAGYAIKKTESNTEKPDEFVDISGPFSIQTLDSLRHEFVKIGEIENYKLVSSPDDYYILDQNPSLKKYYMVQSKKVLDPVVTAIPKSPNDAKRQLLFQLIENCKKEKIISNSQCLAEISDNIKNTRQLVDPSHPTMVQHTKFNSTNKDVIHFESNSSISKQQRTKTPEEKMSNGDAFTQAVDNEENEIIEIMASQSPKKRYDWMDAMLCELPQSPPKSVLDKLIKDLIRSTSGSDKESREGKLFGDTKLWQSNKHGEIDDFNCELLEILNNTRPYSKSDISFKMTPNIFSPISDMEELMAAE